MRLQVNDVVAVLACAALVSESRGALADEIGLGQHQWVPSFAVTSGVTMQDHSGSHASFFFDGESSEPQPTVLRPAERGEDRAVAPFVGGALQLMTPSVLPRFRLFASVEVLPTFATERRLTDEGQAGVISGPEVNSVPHGQEDIEHYTIPKTGPRFEPFGATDAKGQGMLQSAQVDLFAFAAKAGAAFGFQYRGRQMWIKPSVGWYRYKLAVKGFLSHAQCDPDNRCTDLYSPSEPHVFQADGFLRTPPGLKGRDSGVFDAVGAGIDVEMDTARYGPVGTSLYLGIGGYYISGDRDIDFRSKRTFDDQLGNDVWTAEWHTRVAPWVYRAHIGVRFQWLGAGE